MPHLGKRDIRISIHALLAESDASCTGTATLPEVISIHALLAESDIEVVEIGVRCSIFLSTLSLRRATGAPVDRMPSSSISIHALLAESDALQQNIHGVDFQFLSTLSLRRATLEVLYADGPTIFLSTLSLRRATVGIKYRHTAIPISIHALLAESDGVCDDGVCGVIISIHALLAESDRRPRSWRL